MKVAELLAEAEEYLVSRGVDEAAANAEFLLAEVLGTKRTAVRAQGLRALAEGESRRFRRMTRERGRRVPLAYVIGSQPFMGLDIRVDAGVLIPRPETEQLVEAVVDAAGGAGRAGGPPLHILEIGTGSGCVSIALAHSLPEASIRAIDISDAALALAEENASRHRLGAHIRFALGDLFGPSPWPAWADIIVSNPPYVRAEELKVIEPEVLKEPRLALDGGKDGLDALRAIVRQAPASLKKGGRLVLEMGHDQGRAVSGFLRAAGFGKVETKKDLQGHERIASGRLS